MRCPHCGSTDNHGPSHDFFGVVCVSCGEVLVIDRSQRLDRDRISEVILRSIYRGDKSYDHITLECADEIIRELSKGE
jgi:transcription initiation factor TFIIIB Brf1 subunit/transcription initiation factor TFIIB